MPPGWPAGNLGTLQIGLETVAGSWLRTYVTEYLIPLSATNWTHVDRALSPSLANIDKVVGFFYKMSSTHTNTLTFNIDNVMVTKPPPAVAPPTLGIRKPDPAGVLVTMNNNLDQYQRDGISTPEGGGPYLWTAQGSYPVTYSLTIADFPRAATHAGFEAHMYLANGDTAYASDQTVGAPDWNVPDIFILRIQNGGAGNVWAEIWWKTNAPYANATNMALQALASSAVGTWTLTFTNSTEGTLTGPGITATNFTLPADAVLNNFSPATSFMQFGMYKNDGANNGHNNQAHGTFSQVAFTGAAAPFDDPFTGSTLTDAYAWRKTSATAVQFVPTGTALVVDWTLPATDFNAQSAPTITGVWSNAVFSSTYTSGNKGVGLVPAAGLGNAQFYRLIKRPFVKLQVLMPGETAAPNTPSGKTGTPDPQTAGVGFNITVNAVDAVWNRVGSTDTIAITSSDGSATLPANAALAGGTATFSVTLGTAGNWTVTATDVTDGTKTANTGSSTTTN